MRNVILSMFMSLDGYVESAEGKLVPPQYSPEFKARWIDRNLEADLLMYGRVAYEGMVQYWTSPGAAGPEATRLAAAKKLVFSRTLQKADWGQVTIIRDDIAEEINHRKAEPGGDMVLIAGAGIANSFLRLDLIDQLNLIIQPLLLGGGKRLFATSTDQRKLQLVENTTLPGGLIHAVYRK